MGANDGEIFARLREIGEAVARIDERTRRIDEDMRSHHTDHETRIRGLERDGDKRKGAMAVVGSLGGIFGGIVAWICKVIWGGAQ